MFVAVSITNALEAAIAEEWKVTTHGPAPHDWPKKPRSYDILDWNPREGVQHWLVALVDHGPLWAVGVPVIVDADWLRYREWYELAWARVSVAPLVNVIGPRPPLSIPARYPVCLEAAGKLESWYWRGRQVWISGGRPLQQWQAYAELRYVGVDVRGILLPPLAPGMRIGGDLSERYEPRSVGRAVIETNWRNMLDYWGAIRIYERRFFSASHRRGADHCEGPVVLGGGPALRGRPASP